MTFVLDSTVIQYRVGANHDLRYDKMVTDAARMDHADEMSNLIINMQPMPEGLGTNAGGTPAINNGFQLFA